MAKVREKMSLEYLMRMSVMAFAIFGVAFIAGALTPVAAEESYPWCVQADVLHCYYMTREQCEMTVDYHGFCVTNPEMPSQSNEAARGQDFKRFSHADMSTASNAGRAQISHSCRQKTPSAFCESRSTYPGQDRAGRSP